MSPEQRRPDIVSRYAERLKDGILDTAPGHPDERAAQGSPPTGEPSLRQGPTAGAPQRLRQETVLDLDRLKTLGFVRPGAEEKTLLSEQFRLIKRPLIDKALGRGKGRLSKANVIMVTSAQPGEGKTFTAINLALSIASERDIHVLLMDTDVYTQSVAVVLGTSPSQGLLDLLLDDRLDFAGILQHTELPNLTLVPAGTRHSQATELLSSQRMVRLTNDIASRYSDRIIIIDSPPVLASTEATVLASHVGQIVMVVEHNRTGSRQVERALHLLNGCTEISFVLNKVDTLIWDQHFYAKYQYETSYCAK